MSPAVGERQSSSRLWPLECCPSSRDYPALLHTHTGSAKWRKQVLNKVHEDEKKSWMGGQRGMERGRMGGGFDQNSICMYEILKQEKVKKLSVYHQ